MTEPSAPSQVSEQPVQDAATPEPAQDNAAPNPPQQDAQAPEAQPPSPPEPTVTAGELIRQARTDAGLHIAALAVAMKVPVRKLEALEANRLEDFADNTFARALAASVCRHLKTDPKPVLALLPGGNTHILPLKSEGLNTPFHKPGDVVSLGETWQKIRVTVWAVLSLLVGAVVLFAMPQAWLNRPAKVVEVSLPVQAASKPEALAKPGEVIESVVSGASATATLAPAAPESVPVPAPVPQTSAAAKSLPMATPAPVAVAASIPAPLPAPKPAASAPVQAAASVGAEVLSIQAQADTWVDVQDKNGQVLLRRILKAGEKQAVSAKPPIAVSIGNAEKTVVFVRGQAYNLGAVTRENVARFTVN